MKPLEPIQQIIYMKKMNPNSQHEISRYSFMCRCDIWPDTVQWLHSKVKWLTGWWDSPKTKLIWLGAGRKTKGRQWTETQGKNPKEHTGDQNTRNSVHLNTIQRQEHSNNNSRVNTGVFSDTNEGSVPCRNIGHTCDDPAVNVKMAAVKKDKVTVRQADTKTEYINGGRITKHRWILIRRRWNKPGHIQTWCETTQR